MNYTEKPLSRYQFMVFRVLLGSYLFFRFYPILRGVELQSDKGLMIALILLGALLFTAGWERRPAALLLSFAWLPLLHRGSSIGVLWSAGIGLMLLITVFVPGGEPVLAPKFLRRHRSWVFPVALYELGWFLLTALYTTTGLVRITRANWRSGSAILDALENTSVLRGFGIEALGALPRGLMQAGTWLALVVLILALPLGSVRRLRPWVWTATLLLQFATFGIGMAQEVSLGVFLMHLFVLDPEWFPARRASGKGHVVFYDGVCGLCDRTVQFLLAEDRERVLTYAQLQGVTAKEALDSVENAGDLRSVVFAENFGSSSEQISTRSAGILRILDTIGGFWRVISWLRVIPSFLRDAVYRLVARYRYRWFGKFDSCKLPDPDVAKSFLD